ncbi:multidrug resistance-associated protein, partial [Thalictrum thalictroides]
IRSHLFKHKVIESVRGSTGVTTMVEEEAKSVLKEPLLSNKSNVAGYAAASSLSRATFSWMNPLLENGYKSPLKIDDVPYLAPEHDAEVFLERPSFHWFLGTCSACCHVHRSCPAPKFR